MSTDAASLPDDAALLKQLVAQLLDSNAQLERRDAQLEHQLDQLLRRVYGPRSERVDPHQLMLFADDAATIEAPSPPVDEPPASTPRIARAPHGRRQLPANLPRRRIEHALPTDQLPCPGCGQAREKFGEEVSEQLEYEPATLYVVEHVRFKYVCRRCQEHVSVADKPPQPIDKGLPGPGLLAFTAVSKYGDHLPLYRLEEIFARGGVEIARSTKRGKNTRCRCCRR